MGLKGNLINKFFICLCLVVGCIGSFCFNASADITSGLVAYYPLNGNANDESGNGHVGSLQGGISFDQGVCDQAAYLDGIDDYIAFDTLPFYPELTVSFWVKIIEEGSYVFYVANCGPDGRGGISTSSNDRAHGQSLGYYNIKFKAGQNCTTGTPHNMLYPPFKDYGDYGEWSHVVVVYSASSFMNIYINGVLADHDTTDIPSTYMSNLQYFGTDERDPGNRRNFNGWVDDLRIYNRALSQSEVQTLMNECQPGVCVTESHDLNDHQAPEGWELYSSGTYFQDGKLWAAPPDHGGFAKDMTGISGVTSMKFEMDGLVRYSYWGTRVSAQVYFADGSGYRFKHGVEAYDHGNNNAMTIDVLPGNNDAYAEHYPREDGEFHFVVELEDGLAKLYAKRISDGQQVAYLEQELPGLVLDEIVEVRFHVVAQTDNAIWIDNPDFKYCVDVIDSDGDGYSPPEDCDDNDASVNPGADEVCDDSIDNDCDGLTDCDDNECELYSTCDADNDGVPNGEDNCPDVPNGPNGGICIMASENYGDPCLFDSNCGDMGYCDNDQEDSDEDNIGNACDNCPYVSNEDQADNDNNYIGDACEETGNSLCDEFGETTVAFFPGWSYLENQLVYDWIVTQEEIGGEDCFGRCGVGCPGGVGFDCGNEYRYTQACLNHDACVKYYNSFVHGFGYIAPQCWGLFYQPATNDCWDDDLICFEDSDGDMIPDEFFDSPCIGGETEYCDDNCIGISNPNQDDFDSDGVGDVCDDSDGDGIVDSEDECPTEDATGFDADGDGCIDSVWGLTTIVEILVNEGVIDEQMENSLISKINNVLKSADKENICAAVNQLGALISQVNAQRGKKILDEAADQVIAYTQSVINWYLNQLPEGETC